MHCFQHFAATHLSFCVASAFQLCIKTFIFILRKQLTAALSPILCVHPWWVSLLPVETHFWPVQRWRLTWPESLYLISTPRTTLSVLKISRPSSSTTPRSKPVMPNGWIRNKANQSQQKAKSKYIIISKKKIQILVCVNKHFSNWYSSQK